MNIYADIVNIYAIMQQQQLRFSVSFYTSQYTKLPIFRHKILHNFIAYTTVTIL